MHNTQYNQKTQKNPVSVWEGSVAYHKLLSESTKPFRCEWSVIQNTKHSDVIVLQ